MQEDKTSNGSYMSATYSTIRQKLFPSAEMHINSKTASTSESNPETSCCETTELAAAPPCHSFFLFLPKHLTCPIKNADSSAAESPQICLRRPRFEQAHLQKTIKMQTGLRVKSKSSWPANSNPLLSFRLIP